MTHPSQPSHALKQMAHELTTRHISTTSLRPSRPSRLHMSADCANDLLRLFGPSRAA